MAGCRAWALAVLVPAAMLGCQSKLPPPLDPTYHADVAPLIAARCQECHHEGGIAPVPSLADYDNARSYAEPIHAAAELRTMPPWGADNGGWCGTWEGARWLTDDEITILARWHEHGAPEGPPDVVTTATPPAPTPFAASAAVDLGGFYRPGIGAGGNRCFVADPQLDRDRLLTAIRVSSSDPRAVAQITLFALDSDAAEAAAAALDAADPALGYSCFGTTRTPDARMVASWSWPTPVLRLPSGVGVRVPGHRKLVVQVHYDIAATGSAFQSATVVELELNDAATEAAVVPVAAPGPLLPGLEPVVAEATQPAARRMTVVGVAPRMHIRAESMTLMVERGGATSCVGSFPRWSFYESSQLFRARNPMVIEATDVLRISCSYSTLGRTEPVVFGDGIDDEECVAYLLVTP